MTTEEQERAAVIVEVMILSFLVLKMNWHKTNLYTIKFVTYFLCIVFQHIDLTCAKILDYFFLFPVLTKSSLFKLSTV